ncbi:MAG: hypothetical protein Q9165_004847 [Trypethelium subeluteriae]
MEHERQHHGGLHPADYGDDPLGEEFTLQEVKGTDIMTTMQNGEVLAPLHRTERANLQKRFVKILFDGESFTLNFFPFWSTGYLDPDWDAFLSCLEARDIPKNGEDWDRAVVTPSRPIYDARSFGRALKRLLRKPADYTETWIPWGIAPNDASFSSSEDSAISVPLSAITPISPTPSSTSSQLKRKSSNDEDGEPESSGGSSKRVKVQGGPHLPLSSSIRTPKGGFSTSNRANPNPLGLRVNIAKAESYSAENHPGGPQVDPTGAVEPKNAPQDSEVEFAINDINGLEYEPIGTQGSPDQFRDEFGAGFIFEEPSPDNEAKRDLRDWLLNSQSA